MKASLAGSKMGRPESWNRQRMRKRLKSQVGEAKMRGLWLSGALDVMPEMLAFGLTSRENTFSGALYKSSHMNLGLGKGTSGVQ